MTLCLSPSLQIWSCCRFPRQPPCRQPFLEPIRRPSWVAPSIRELLFLALRELQRLVPPALPPDFVFLVTIPPSFTVFARPCWYLLRMFSAALAAFKSFFACINSSFVEDADAVAAAFFHLRVTLLVINNFIDFFFAPPHRAQQHPRRQGSPHRRRPY